MTTYGRGWGEPGGTSSSTKRKWQRGGKIYGPAKPKKPNPIKMRKYSGKRYA